MIRATPQMRDLAARVVAFEARANDSSGAGNPVAFAICEKLRPHWANLMGSIGFRTLLSRALVSAHGKAAWLRAVHVQPDGVLAWSDKPEGQMAAGEMAAGEMAVGSAMLLVELLGLLEGFIGETLAMRMMQDVWPKLSPSDSDSEKGHRK